jgi:hypothetical protein
MNKTLWSGLILSVALAAGCASTDEDPGPPDDTGTPIPLVAAPDFEVPATLDDYPDLYRRGKCVTVAATGGLADEEFENFVDAFAEEFFGVCFTSIDADIMNKARSRAAVFTGVPPSDRMTVMANEAGCDFTLYITLSIEDRAVEGSDNVNRRDVSGKMRANATVKLVGSAAKDTKEQATTLKLDLSGRLSKLMGTALAKKFLNKVGKAGGVAAENVVDLTFKFFDASDKREIREMLQAIGIKLRDMREVSAQGSAQFIYRVNTKMNIMELRVALENQLEDEEFDDPRISQPQANMLLIKNRQ